jgi:hypothetical protein
MRDELPQLAAHLEDIESITTTERTEAPGVVSLVNIWRAKPKLPEFLARYVDATKFAWTDRALWDEATKTCIWRIEPHVFGSYFESHGETRFEPAMGGRGTRITFSGEAEIKIGNVGDGVRKVLEDTLFKGAMSFAQGIIAKNFRKMADALGAHLDAQVCAASTPLPGDAATTKRGKR